jgi:hypothetical protein
MVAEGVRAWRDIADVVPAGGDCAVRRSANAVAIHARMLGLRLGD